LISTLHGTRPEYEREAITSDFSRPDPDDRSPAALRQARQQGRIPGRGRHRALLGSLDCRRQWSRRERNGGLCTGSARITSEHPQAPGEFPYRVEGLADTVILHVALDVDVEQILPRSLWQRPALELGEVQALPREYLQAISERSAFVVDGEEE